jgi:hypothetical protein
MTLTGVYSATTDRVFNHCQGVTQHPVSGRLDPDSGDGRDDTLLTVGVAKRNYGTKLSLRDFIEPVRAKYMNFDASANCQLSIVNCQLSTVNCQFFRNQF